MYLQTKYITFCFVSLTWRTFDSIQALGDPTQTFTFTDLQSKRRVIALYWLEM